jgi:hypothetical protein
MSLGGIRGSQDSDPEENRKRSTFDFKDASVDYDASKWPTAFVLRLASYLLRCQGL